MKRTALASHAVLLFGILLTILSGTAGAHAAYEGSEPANGSTVSSPPSRVTADFTEGLTTNSYLAVYDPCGQQVDGSDSLVARDQILVSMSADKSGTYTVRFDVISDVDGHETEGEFTFTSSGGGACPSEEPSSGDGGGQTDDRTGGDPDGSRVGGRSSTGSSATQAGGRDGDGRTQGRDDAERRAQGEAGGRPGGGKAPGSQAAGDEEFQTPSVEEISIWDGIPLGDFLIALAVSALIGAAGGRIYAGIVGPRR